MRLPTVLDGHLVIAALLLSLSISGGGDSIKTRPASGAVLDVLRKHFMHEEVVRWLMSGSMRSQFRAELAQAGYLFVGVERQSGQDVDAFSLSAVVNGTC